VDPKVVVVVDLRVVTTGTGEDPKDLKLQDQMEPPIWAMAVDLTLPMEMLVPLQLHLPPLLAQAHLV